MGGACVRQFCSAVAAVRVDFDGRARVVWIDDLGEGRPAAAMCLCRHHADTLRPPRNWELRDLRPSGAPEPPELREPAATAEPVPTVSFDAPPTPAIEEPVAGWSPRLFASVDAGPVLDARSPLLSRAFRGI
ncbi:MAG TPA: hypothetical protein VFF40_12100 [Acidimicrobiia bacterium]|nr:hypothetical protein [Acidimicrobiia bacterium]